MWRKHVRIPPRHSAAFKFKVALEAAKAQRTINEIGTEFGMHPNQVTQWKQALPEGGESLFCQPGGHCEREGKVLQAELYEQIGRLKMELEWLKKAAARRDDLADPH